MQYKTIVLELLRQSPLHDQLKKERKLLPTLNLLARQLKARHEFWKERLSQTRPGSEPSQIASSALELALKELENRLSSGLASENQQPLTLEAAMEFIRRHTPPV